MRFTAPWRDDRDLYAFYTAENAPHTASWGALDVTNR
jgi:hypothetical protein